MNRVSASFDAFLRDESGVTAIEYGLVASIVSITILTSITYFGTQVNSFLTAAANAIKGP
ncbi:Flp family type IVb pilin [Bosea sp. SSUT16]|jgi:pilus assembly protein Flp/PilA|uniref:Flp family type IVb pilin n=1 Tax=Bosea spartocytisi TaxID=2773451 RepID=A0A927EAZ4_9HYPH|nr:Flp family type IVb pilin [Bosea spartocytisi]MBD3846635.1 Flp family type IVb pilin [Bosea spartocytisi]MCT4473730.1 Flp family type IVb pilin [Bosea spartocytisi]